ncbi:Hpt domain-containing protein [Cypionkella psychrotolerans]|uniref:Hpt domain-containing protein n=1 Tax=Cypionkella psychrotolerans TaxID=1678131 RepID=UPI0006B6336B|nr:Hpt domain-containing protein [Cypionkella psychrotolerans]
MTGLQYFGGSAGGGANDMTAVLEPARAMFRGLIVERIMAFEAYRKLVQHGENPQDEMAKIADIAHKISGVGATLGFFRTGQLAGVLDRAITENLAKCADPEYFRLIVDPMLEALLIEMESLLDD